MTDRLVTDAGLLLPEGVAYRDFDERATFIPSKREVRGRLGALAARGPWVRRRRACEPKRGQSRYTVGKLRSLWFSIQGGRLAK
jgi:hypothetical protein